MRYGEVREGTSALIFVTEPFSKSKQVKLDNWRDTSSDNVSVLKLNMTKKFTTGIYPYSMMMSTFKPVSIDQYQKVFKVSSSTQEWCGHTWLQLNASGKGYDLSGFSYFESEGDVEEELKDVLLEDEIWSTIRLNPANLPVGDLSLLPSTFYLRLKHVPFTEQKAKAELRSLEQSEFSSAAHQQYNLTYDNRSLSIYFEQEFPYQILGWEEKYRDRRGSSEMQITQAKRIKSIKSAYWGENSNADQPLRTELGLE
ncbi:MAG: hypothetical protein AAF789_01545 [Bacteroidota bacterium]